MRTRRVPLSILILIFGATMLLAGAVYIELSREVTDAIVLSKRERVVPDLSGTTWSQQSEVLVRYQIDHRLYEGWTRMSSSQYDTVHRRDTIQVSYATINPEWVRPAGRSVFTSIVYRVQPWQSFTWLMLIVGH